MVHQSAMPPQVAGALGSPKRGRAKKLPLAGRLSPNAPCGCAAQVQEPELPAVTARPFMKTLRGNKAMLSDLSPVARCALLSHTHNSNYD